MKANPIDKYLGTHRLGLHERISARPQVHFQPGSPKHSTKNEMGEIATDLRRPAETIDVSKLGADGFAMTFDTY